LAQNRPHLFQDEDFAALYGQENGRTSVPPRVAITILFLRAYERVSFVEAIERDEVRTALEGGLVVGNGRSADAEEHSAGV
jgi:hypothetical protein